VRAKRRSSERLVDTPQGPARLHVHEPDAGSAGALVLGHGAGGGVGAPDLAAATTAAIGAGWRVILVEQPWHVAGRRIAVAPPRLDEAWLAALAAAQLDGPLVVGGRSAGARVACRTAVPLAAGAVLALAFPLHPPGRPERSRSGELAGSGVPVVVVQGERDPFGSPADLAALGLADVEIVPAPGDHALRAAAGAVADGARRALAAAGRSAAPGRAP
jgi:predicted alpha/beta-hydrolase family hydrolase